MCRSLRTPRTQGISSTADNGHMVVSTTLLPTAALFSFLQERGNQGVKSALLRGLLAQIPVPKMKILLKLQRLRSSMPPPCFSFSRTLGNDKNYGTCSINGSKMARAYYKLTFLLLFQFDLNHAMCSGRAIQMNGLLKSHQHWKPRIENLPL